MTILDKTFCTICYTFDSDQATKNLAENFDEKLRRKIKTKNLTKIFFFDKISIFVQSFRSHISVFDQNILRNSFNFFPMTPFLEEGDFCAGYPNFRFGNNYRKKLTHRKYVHLKTACLSKFEFFN